MKSGNLFIESVEPNSLPESDFKEIAEVEKDMWAYGIGEYVKCDNCNCIYSKNDIYNQKIEEVSKYSVTEIEKILEIENIYCKSCKSKTHYIYDIEKNIEEIKKRLLNTFSSYITLLKDDTGIVGFIDGYIDSFDKIYENEFKSHYDLFGKYYLGYLVEQELGQAMPDKLFSFSSMGTIEKYKSFSIVFDLIYNFSHSISDEYEDILGITELDKGSNLHSFYHSIGIKELGLDNEKYSDKFINKNLDYNSDIFLKPSFLKEAKDNFSVGVREFILKYRKKMKEVLIA